MKKLNLTLGVLTILIASAFTVIESVNWKVKEDTYTVTFKGGKVNGTIKGIKATILFDEANPEKSKITASMDANTVNTGNGMMNKHALSDDALCSEKFPLITFASDAVAKKGASYEATGKLTMKGVTKDVVLPFTFENKGSDAIFNGHLTIAPKEYGITRGGTPDQLDIDMVIPVTK